MDRARNVGLFGRLQPDHQVTMRGSQVAGDRYVPPAHMNKLRRRRKSCGG
jgi:hypothetical protein